MKAFVYQLSFLSWPLLLEWWYRHTVVQAADILFLYNARIYTGDTADDQLLWAEAVAMDTALGLILSVGSTEEIRNTFNSHEGNITEIDLDGRLVLPGFHDAHLHVVEAGLNSQLCLLDLYTPLDELDFYFYPDEEYCSTGGPFGDQGWIVGAGLDVGYLLQMLDDNNPETFPITHMDRFFPDTPAFILDAYGHGAIANTLALNVVGFTASATDPSGGILVRSRGGQLTGLVLENAQQPLRDAAFPPTAANQQTAYNGFLDTLNLLAQNGITTVSDAGGFWRQAQLDMWQRASQQGRLTVRAYNALYIYPDQPLEDQLATLQKYSEQTNDSNLVHFTQAKIYVDGILSLGTSALYEPYTDASHLPVSGGLGFEYFGGDRLSRVVSTLADFGFQLHLHVTGDRGAGLALDAIAALNDSDNVNHSANLTHRLTHCYLVDPADISRFAELDVVADFQLAPSSLDPEYLSFLQQLIGEERVKSLFPVDELLDAGATVILSSDYDADELSPLSKIQTVLMAGFERLNSVEAVLPLLTRVPAEFLRSNAGVLQPGKYGDLVVLSNDIFSLDVDKIGDTQVLMTVFHGRIIFDPTSIAGTTIGEFPSFANAPLVNHWNLYVLSSVMVFYHGWF